jgi:hypothetical protein
MQAAAISKITAYEAVAIRIIRMTNIVMERRARIVTFEAAISWSASIPPPIALQRVSVRHVSVRGISFSSICFPSKQKL